MNIVFLTRLYHPHIGGVERHVASVSRLLCKRHSIIIITEKFQADLPDYEKRLEGEIYRIPVLGAGDSAKKWVIWEWLLSHRHILDEADVIHAHDVYFWLFPYKLFHPFKKTFVTFHGWESVYPVPVKNIIVRKVSELLASGNICVGDFISKWYHTHPTFVTYGAV